MSRLTRACALLLLIVCAAGCIDRTRLNPGCEWTGDAAVPLDLTRRADRRHLVADAQLAEGLAVRYADTEHRRRFGYGGHGGLIDKGRLLHACMASLVEIIERDHAVTAAQIEAARPQRNPWFDGPVMLSFVAIYVLAAISACRSIRRRFLDSSRGIVAIVVGAASIGFSALGLQAGVLWSMICESARIGDDHFGTFRATRSPWAQHLAIVYAGGVVLFWVVAAFMARRPTRADAVARPSAVTALFDS
jgi:uncharacterized membrane protein YjgN (DUF898 family)